MEYVLIIIILGVTIYSVSERYFEYKTYNMKELTKQKKLDLDILKEGNNNA